MQKDTSVPLAEGMSPEEKQLREHLALSYRCAHKNDLNEGCDNHLSACLESQDAFLTLPYGILWSTVQPEDLILVDFDGKVLKESARKDAIEGHVYEPDVTAIQIHGKIHKKLGVRAKVVFHTHQHYATTLACLPDNYEIEMIHQGSNRFYKSVLYYRDFNGLVDNDAEGNKIADEFLKAGNERKRIMQMHHHGLLVVGPNCWEAMDDLYFFEKTARLQVEMVKIGGDPKKCALSDEDAKMVYDQIFCKAEAGSAEVHRADNRHWLTYALFNGWKFADY